MPGSSKSEKMVEKMSFGSVGSGRRMSSLIPAEEEDIETLEAIPEMLDGVALLDSLSVLFRLRFLSSLYVFSRDSYRFLSPKRNPRSGRSGW